MRVPPSEVTDRARRGSAAALSSRTPTVCPAGTATIPPEGSEMGPVEPYRATVAVTVVAPGLVRRSSAEEPTALDPPTIHDTAPSGAQGAAVRPRRSPASVSVVTSPVALAEIADPGCTVRMPPSALSMRSGVEGSSSRPP